MIVRLGTGRIVAQKTLKRVDRRNCQNLLYYEEMSFLTPASIAVVGASSEAAKVGGAIFQNLITQGYKGPVYPVNAKHPEVLGKKAYATLKDLPEVPDLVVIVTPAATVEAVAEECGTLGVKNVVVISAGFAEIGTDEGRAREVKLKEIATKYGITLLGPNCLGMLRPSIGLNASFGKDLPKPGNIALLSQSGALAVAVMDASRDLGLGFSEILSLGNKALVNECDALELCAYDEETKVIGFYLESITDGKRFMQIAKTLQGKKRIVLLKAGRTAKGSHAVSSHTGALAGSDAAITALCEEAGIARAKTMEEFLDFLSVFSMQPVLASPKIAVITNAGGPGILATDAAEDLGLELVSLSEPGAGELKKNLPAAASIGNPIDVLGDAADDRYLKAIEAAARDPNVDGLCVLLTPQIMTPVDAVAKVILEAKRSRPLLSTVVSFMGGVSVHEALQTFANHGIPAFPTPERAVAALKALSGTLRAGVPARVEDINHDRQKKALMILNEKTSALSEEETRKLFEIYELPLPSQSLATTKEEAATFAENMRFPVVLKISSPDILHKTDAGGVRLNVKSKQEAEAAFTDIMSAVKKSMPRAAIRGVLVQKQLAPGHEFIVGALKDPSVGHLVMAGLGGIYTELFRDTAFRIAPVNDRDAYTMLESLKSWKLLLGMRGEAMSNIPALAETIQKVSMLVSECPTITELDLNPVIVDKNGVTVADAKIVLKQDKIK